MLKEKLLEDMKVSMREKNIIRKNVIQMVRAAILQVEKDKQVELSDEQIIEVIAKESKKKKRFFTRLREKWKRRFNFTSKRRNRNIIRILTKAINKRRIRKNSRRCNK